MKQEEISVKISSEEMQQINLLRHSADGKDRTPGEFATDGLKEYINTLMDNPERLNTKRLIDVIAGKHRQRAAVKVLRLLASQRKPISMQADSRRLSSILQSLLAVGFIQGADGAYEITTTGLSILKGYDAQGN